jgi:DNA helicase-2/ATP-dependent DNA helicase PcrA
MSITTPQQMRAALQESFTFSDPQWDVISAPLEPSVVIAGAGSGKTTVMAARVVYLVANGLVEPGAVLGLTFTTKAAASLRQKVRGTLVTAGLIDPLDPELAEPTVATYNSYAASLLSEHGLRIAHEPDTRVLADASRYQLAARVVARHRGDIRRLSDHAETVIRNLLSLDSAMSEHLVAPTVVLDYDAEQRRGFERALQTEIDGKNRKGHREACESGISATDRRAELMQLVTAYREAKSRHGMMDFSDQIALAARLVDGYPDVARLERDKFAVVLLDEYQDTSVAQARLLGGLFSGPDAEQGRGHPVTAVGDPNQAIYGWRGASVSNILHFTDTFPPAHDGVARSFPLRVSRRSGHRIVEAANHLAADLYAGSPGVEELQAAPEAGQGEVAALVMEHKVAELDWLAQEVPRTHRAMDEPKWSEIAVLTRDNAHAAEVFDALTRADVPVEIVGLNGLLRLPEVAEVVATLRLLHDLTANDALLTLLTGPRWAIGPRDLALLGHRATQIAGFGGRRERPDEVVDELAQHVEGHDPTEIPSLSDALTSPGPAAYSPQARDRFALLAGELRRLRGFTGEPLLDLVRRIIDTCGIDIELASAVSQVAAARRDNLDLFVKAVAEFQGIDGEVTLPALLAYLLAEDELGTGLDIATPSEADSVKLLTVHRAKGLEWDVVFLVGAGETRFPTTTARSTWISSPAVIPNELRGDYRDLAVLHGYDKESQTEFKQRSKALDLTEELRLGYVAFTRPRHRLVVSSYLWGDRPTPFGPSSFQVAVRECMAGWGELPVEWWEKPPPKTPNPYASAGRSKPWPITGPTREAELRVKAVEVVRGATQGSLSRRPEGLSSDELALVESWDDTAGRLLVEARREASPFVEVPLPASLSATAVARLRDDPEQFARDLARPMPRQPSPSARFGTRFHAWVEARFGQQALLDPDDLPGRGDLGIDDEDDLRALISVFESGPFGDRVPHAVEAPFALVLAGQVVRGRIDAVYAEPGGGWLVIDWKTNRQQTADPLQLALYRLAWAELLGVPLDRVSAGFHYVRSGETVLPPDLPDRDGLEDLLRGEAPD